MSVALDHHQLVVGHVVLVLRSAGQLWQLKVVLLDDLPHELVVVLRESPLGGVEDVQVVIDGQLGHFFSQGAVGLQATQQGRGDLDLGVADRLSIGRVEFSDVLCPLLEDALSGSFCLGVGGVGDIRTRATNVSEDQCDNSQQGQASK